MECVLGVGLDPVTCRSQIVETGQDSLARAEGQSLPFDRSFSSLACHDCPSKSRHNNSAPWCEKRRAALAGRSTWVPLGREDRVGRGHVVHAWQDTLTTHRTAVSKKCPVAFGGLSVKASSVHYRSHIQRA
jgi:hypothetical protein